MSEERYVAALAGLIHDMGKIIQRATETPRKLPDDLQGSGQPAHAAWTMRLADAVPQPYRKAAIAGVYHHNPDMNPGDNRHISQIVELADKLSAGERVDPPDPAAPLIRQIVTIFDRLQGRGSQSSNNYHYLKPLPLRLTEDCFMPDIALVDTETGNLYSALKERLEKVIQDDPGDLAAYLEKLQSEFQRISWAVPSAYYHSVPDVSLYDHCRMTAALAACLVDFRSEEVSALTDAIRREFQGKPTGDDATLLEKPVCLLVGGDISGIQDFIFTITAKGAARMLRGRSFYLQLLTEAILRFILNSLELPYTQVIYTGGGHFFFLAPLSAASVLPDLQKQVSSILLRAHGTSIYCALGYATVPARKFKAGGIGEVWDVMHGNIMAQKLARYHELSGEIHAEIFQPPEYGGNPDIVCAVCESEHEGISRWDAEQDINICPFCRSIVDQIGKALPNSDFLVFSYTSPNIISHQFETVSDVLAAFGMRFKFVKSGDTPQPLGNEHAVMWALGDVGDSKWPGLAGASRWTRYSFNHIPHGTFEDLEARTEGGFKRLGILRMDVDNLGEMFKSGLRGDSASGVQSLHTLARLSTLSFQVSLYFEGWLKKICEEANYRDLVYGVYSGGDDAFLLGPWDIIPGLAMRIRQDFDRYTGGHPALLISAGITFLNGKQPIYQGAEEAGEALAQAKLMDGKNAITFLDRAWNWDEFTAMNAKKTEVLEKIDDLGGPNALLQLLQRLAIQARQTDLQTGKILWLPRLWLGEYQIHRMIERSRGNPPLQEALVALREQLGQSMFQDIAQWGYAARWLQLQRRNKQHDQR